MPYLIDGHNLIPKIPGLSLQAADDEIHLVELLQEFCRVERKAVEVYFDNAPPGQSGTRRFGQVTAHFVRRGNSADLAIRQRLARLGKSAPNWTVVSSDGEVQSAARLARAQVTSAESFVKAVQQSLEKTTSPEKSYQEGVLSPEEVEEWLRLFGQK
jgi:hypothetical protein